MPAFLAPSKITPFIRTNAKPAEIKAQYASQLDPTWASELRNRMRLAGLPIRLVAKNVVPPKWIAVPHG